MNVFPFLWLGPTLLPFRWRKVTMTSNSITELKKKPTFPKFKQTHYCLRQGFDCFSQNFQLCSGFQKNVVKSLDSYLNLFVQRDQSKAWKTSWSENSSRVFGHPETVMKELQHRCWHWIFLLLPKAHEATKQNQKEENWKAHVVSEKGRQLCGQREEAGHLGADHRGPPAKHVEWWCALRPA